MSGEYCGIAECTCPDPDDVRERELDKILNTVHVANLITTSLREDRVRDLTGRDIEAVFLKPDDDPFPGVRFPEHAVDVPKLFEFLAKLVCPPVCVGYVNRTGWHQLCEEKARRAIQALGFTAPELTPIPEADRG